MPVHPGKTEEEKSLLKEAVKKKLKEKAKEKLTKKEE